MSKVYRSRDCGNSPKNTFAQDIAIAIEKRDVAVLDKALAADATCSLADGTDIARHEFLEGMNAGGAKPATIRIDRVVTHGKAGAVTGVSRLGNTSRHFCHVIHFAGAKGDLLTHISSYGKPVF